MASRRGRAGYALLAVLWVCTGIAALSALMLARARSAVAASRNRIALATASWNAAACVVYARAAVTDALGEETQMLIASRASAWHRVDAVLTAAPPPATYACTLTAVPAGSRVDVNAADAATLAALFRHLGMRVGQADSAAAAATAARPFVAVRELRKVPPLATLPRLENVLDVEPGPIAVNEAPAEVLALLPGFTQELVERVMDSRRREQAIATFGDLGHGLSAGARDTLAASSARLPGLVVLEPSAWILTAASSVGRPPVTAVVEVRLGRTGVHTTLTRRKTWVQ